MRWTMKRSSTTLHPTTMDQTVMNTPLPWLFQSQGKGEAEHFKSPSRDTPHHKHLLSSISLNVTKNDCVGMDMSQQQQEDELTQVSTQKKTVKLDSHHNFAMLCVRCFTKVEGDRAMCDQHFGLYPRKGLPLICQFQLIQEEDQAVKLEVVGSDNFNCDSLIYALMETVTSSTTRLNEISM